MSFSKSAKNSGYVFAVQAGLEIFTSGNRKPANDKLIAMR